jgi:hypothetical protein
MSDSRQTSRRNFIKLATATTLAAGATNDAVAAAATHVLEAPRQQTQPTSPNDRIRIATIGVGAGEHRIRMPRCVAVLRHRAQPCRSRC